MSKITTSFKLAKAINKYLPKLNTDGLLVGRVESAVASKLVQRTTDIEQWRHNIRHCMWGIMNMV